MLKHNKKLADIFPKYMIALNKLKLFQSIKMNLNFNKIMIRCNKLITVTRTTSKRRKSNCNIELEYCT